MGLVVKKHGVVHVMVLEIDSRKVSLGQGGHGKIHVLRGSSFLHFLYPIDKLNHPKQQK